MMMFVIYLAVRPNAPRVEMKSGIANGAIAFVDAEDRSEAVRKVETEIDKLGYDWLYVDRSGLVANDALPDDAPEQLKLAYQDALRTGFDIVVFTDSIEN